MKIFAISFLIIFVLSCSNQGRKDNPKSKRDIFGKGTYGYDLKVLKEYTKLIELVNENFIVCIGFKNGRNTVCF